MQCDRTSCIYSSTAGTVTEVLARVPQNQCRKEKNWFFLDGDVRKGKRGKYWGMGVDRDWNKNRLWMEMMSWWGPPANLSGATLSGSGGPQEREGPDRKTIWLLKLLYLSTLGVYSYRGGPEVYYACVTPNRKNCLYELTLQCPLGMHE